jgi:hypothetical protein
MRVLGIGLGLLLLVATSAAAQEPYQGHTLISPINSPNSHLIDMDGTVLRTWHGGQTPTSMAYLLEDDAILRPCVDSGGSFPGAMAGGRLQIIDSTDTVVWDYLFSTYGYQQHHDIEPMPNGNVLVIAWERKTEAEAIAMGRVDAAGEMWPTLIAEIEPDGATGGNIVWEWHLWDHLIQDADPGKPNYGVVADHPELLDINAATIRPISGDWIHANAISYNPLLDQIVFSARATDELYVIDHSTTSAEAAGHTGGDCGKGGDFLYRWGNPQIYGRGDESDRQYNVIHGANWIDAGLPGEGNILTFNNGDRPGTANDYSVAVEVAPPIEPNGNYTILPGEPYGPAAPEWSYGGPGGFYAGPTHGGAYRLPNGNTAICSPPRGHLFEVTTSGVEVWDYTYGAGNIARAERYWGSPVVAVEDDVDTTHPDPRLDVTPNPFGSGTQVTFQVAEWERVRLVVFDIAGRRVATLAEDGFVAGEHRFSWDGRGHRGERLPPGVYLLQLRGGSFSAVKRVVLFE